MKISVLTPSYNSQLFLDRAIRSVQQQDYEHWEHIVIDGGSTDGTLELLQKYPHLIWKSEPDKGQSDAMNKAFAVATGDVIVYLNADDYFEPNIFGLVVDSFKESGADMVVGKLNSINKTEQPRVRTPSILLEDILDVAELKFPLNPVSYFYKRCLQEAIGSFPVDNHIAMDFWFLLRAYQRGSVSFIDKVLGNFHQHGENKTSAFGVSQMGLLDVLLEFCAENNIDSSRYVRNLFQKVLRQYEKQKDHGEVLSKQIQGIKASFFYRVGRKTGILKF